ncbi:hypothetical protein QE370_000657 [Aeromicrobium sp. SORGH_AS981]|uniref:hypothetical protein n=1 Tax=Aeromicrobium sp. SORGH_AS_0981 TaxID=3041802 RepID=UPI00285E6D1D|nr:hypothetical protein [Aeromicrobium sp. SORGH_AS_0981]MDR6117473.1 hypothetical protein [Aeromicrobium sp. SORGH_AS_0981]
MTENLTDLIRQHATSQPVPELDLDGVIRSGRRAGRRRAVVRRSVATLAIGAVAGTAVAVSGVGRDAGSSLQVESSISASDVDLVSSAYRTGGAFSRGDTVWFSDPDYSVDLGTAVQTLYYTADGVIAAVSDDDAGDAPRGWVYVGTDGTVRRLDLPRKVVPGADASADRLAYVTKAGSGYEVHVVEASSGDELAVVPFDGGYTWAGWSVPPIGLTGDYVVVGTNEAQKVLNWRTGREVASVPGEQLPSTGGGRALGGDHGSTAYRLGDSRQLRSTADLTVGSGDARWASNELSPDGRFVQTTTTFVSTDEDGTRTVVDGVDGDEVRNPVVHVTDLDTGRRITLPGDGFTYGWTPDGRLVKVEGSRVTTCDAATGDCSTRTVPDGPGKIRVAGTYVGS